MTMRFAVVVVLFLAVLSFLAGETLSTGLQTTPSLYIPVGQKSDYYDLGLGATLESLFVFPSVQHIAVGLDLGFSFIPLSLGQGMFSTDSNLSLLGLGPVIRAGWDLGNRFSLAASARGFGYTALLSGNESGTELGLGYGLGAELGFVINPTWKISIGSTFRSYLGIYDGMAVDLGVTTRLSGPGGASLPRKDFMPVQPGVLPGGGNIRFLEGQLSRVFPVLYKYYDTHPIGRATIENVGDLPVEDLEIRFRLSQYMDAPKLSSRIDVLNPGESRDVEIYVLFNESILGITEGARLSGEMVADYKVDGRPGVDTDTITLEAYDRNAIRWDDDRKVASFVTARDEQIQKLSRNVASLVRDEGLEGFSSEFQLAVALLGMLDAYGCAYVVDPSSSYLELSQDASAIDSVQFPRQTLQYRAGDCDDLSAAYAALMESVGVETAFITVPGHIYTAFRLDMSPREAESAFTRIDDLIVLDDDVWIPVETTALRRGFLEAWSLGARQWREHEEQGSARLLPIRNAWHVYEPVAFSVSSYELEMADRQRVTGLFVDQMEQYVDREISSRESILLSRLENDPGDIQSLNSLGVLYARYGRNDEARELFLSAIKDQPYVPALLNLGHLAFMEQDWQSAEGYYSRAADIEPEKPAVILGLARVSHALEQYGRAERGYRTLAALSPDLAERYAYLSGGREVSSRASDAVAAGPGMLWEDE